MAIVGVVAMYWIGFRMVDIFLTISIPAEELEGREDRKRSINSMKYGSWISLLYIITMFIIFEIHEKLKQ